MQLAAPGPAGRLDHVPRGGCLRVPAGAYVVGRQELAEPADWEMARYFELI